MVTQELIKKAFQIACEEIAIFEGACPFDIFGFAHPDGCERVCGRLGTNSLECWQLFFLEQARKSQLHQEGGKE